MNDKTPGKATGRVEPGTGLNGLRIVIPIPPRTKKNSQTIVRVKGRPLIIQSKPWREYEKFCIGTKTRPGYLMQYGNICYDVPVQMMALYWLDTNRKTDLMGLIQGTADILEKAGILADDALIKSLDGCRIMGKDAVNPRCEILITELPEV